MENTGKGRIISNPRVITMDGVPASIRQGKSIPYATVSERGTETKFVDANLELKVSPHITPDGTIVLDVNVTKNEPDFANTVNGQPAIDKKEATTRVLIKNGATLVIGGIFKSTESESLSGVPGAKRLPLLRWLFQKEQKSNDVTELLIFITPQIVKALDE
jgi:type IV pilus assembly protein PilQ